MTIRPYQQEAINAIHREWNSGHKKTLLVLPTGTGKTVVFCKVAEDEVAHGGRGLILAHREELLEQAADKMRRTTGIECAVEKADSHSMASNKPVTVGSIQTLCRESRLAQFPPNWFNFLIVDEAHHVLADSYTRILDHFGGANVLGVTATPDRGDKKNLGKIFDSLAYEYSMRSAVKDGYLCPIKAQTIPLELDLSNVGVQSGDFKAGDLGTALDPYLEQIADEMTRYCHGHKTVVFLPLVATSQKFRDILNSRGFRAAEVNGNSHDRAEILQAFDNGEYNVLCNSMLLTEGWDCPSVDCIVVLRPTKIRALYAQMVGRGTRLSPGKDHLLILDFLWHTTRHMLCKPASLICQKNSIAEKVTEYIDNEDEAVDLLDAEEAAESDALKEREEALAEELASMRKRKRQLVDPLQYAFSIGDEYLADYEPTWAWEMGPASEKQLATLERNGIFPDQIQNAGMASELISRIIARSKEGLTTAKQIRCLEKYGYQHVGEWQKEEANHIISILQGVSWKPWRIPRELDPETYIPPSQQRFGNV